MSRRLQQPIYSFRRLPRPRVKALQISNFNGNGYGHIRKVLTKRGLTFAHWPNTPTHANTGIYRWLTATFRSHPPSIHQEQLGSPSYCRTSSSINQSEAQLVVRSSSCQTVKQLPLRLPIFRSLSRLHASSTSPLTRRHSFTPSLFP